VGLVAFGWTNGQGGLGMANIGGKISPSWESNLVRAVDRNLLHFLKDRSPSLTKDFIYALHIRKMASYLIYTKMKLM
jgi:hypothetical protein